MTRASAPTLRRNHSSSDGSCVDPYDKAEQGFQIGSEDLSGSRPPLEAKKILSFRSSLRSSDSTLVGLPAHEDIVDDSRKPLPDQGRYQTILHPKSIPIVSGQLPRTTTWTTWCFNKLPHVSFLRSVSQESPGPPPVDYQKGYDQFQFECCEFPNLLS
jgi:hypothetical protein